MKFFSHFCALSFCFVLFALGCGGTPRAASPETGSSSPDAWREYEFVGEGLSAHFPGPPRESWSPGDGAGAPERHLLMFGSGEEFGLIRTPGLPAKRQPDSVILDAFRSRMKEVESERDITLGPFRGREIQGIFPPQLHVIVRVYVVGDSLVLALVADKKRPDPERARRFLDSVRFEMPWMIEPVLAGQFSVAVPARGVALDKKSFGWDDDMEGGGRALGGVDEVSYFYGTSVIHEDFREAPPDEAIDVFVAGTGLKLVHQAPLEFDGMRARDLLFEGSRIRVIVVGTRIYYLGMDSLRRETVTGPDAERFFASFRRYESN